jgi:hypothetical protein
MYWCTDFCSRDKQIAALVFESLWKVFIKEQIVYINSQIYWGTDFLDFVERIATDIY